MAVGNNLTVTGTAAMASSFKRNRIINGNMLIDQRNAGASVTISSYGYGLDRWGYQCSGGGAWSSQRSAVAPAGFPNSLILTVTTADASIGSTDVYQLFQKIEGFNVSDFGFGTASAQTITVSFWVRSSVTGTYSASFQNAAFNRGYVATFTVNAANTFEYKTITIPGDTSGTWDTTNGIGLQFAIDLGSGSASNIAAGSWQSVSTSSLRTSGSVNWIATSGATFYITGVQLEVGTIATPYERQIYSDQLAQCQRYFQTSYFGSPVGTATTTNSVFYTVWANTNYSYLYVNLLVSMRTTPTNVSYSTNNGASGVQYNLSLGNQATTFAQITNYGFTNQITNLAATAGQNYYFHWTASAEL